MNLLERLDRFEKNKIEEKTLLKRIKLRKYKEALEDINKQVELGLRCDEITFNIDLSSVKVASYLGFKSEAIGLSNATFKITKKGLKNLDEQLKKYKIGD